MRAVVQRVRGAGSYLGPGRTQLWDGPGLVVLLGWGNCDAPEYAQSNNPDLSLGQSLQKLWRLEQWMIERVDGLRIFPDSDGKMNLNLAQYCDLVSATGTILWVPQFTLYGELSSGFRPSFTTTLAPEVARKRFETLSRSISESRLKPAEPLRAQIQHIFGDFGAEMHLQFTNWGPVTLLLEREP